MRAPRIKLITNHHLGDVVILTAVIRNLLAEYPEAEVDYAGPYRAIFDFAPGLLTVLPSAREVPAVYAPFSQKTADGGNCVEGFSRSLFAALGLRMPYKFRHHAPVLELSEEDREEARKYEDAIILNANWQECSQTKAYPHWQEVVRMVPARFIRIGSSEDRDRGYDIEGVEDVRGKTTIRELVRMCAGCRAIVSPASAVVHIGAAFSKPTVCITGAREPMTLTSYKNVYHLTSECGRFSRTYGCMCFRLRQCRNARDGFPACMADIPPERIADALNRITGGLK